MKLSIEKRPANNEESYFVFTHGEKKLEMAANAAKAILLLWVFCSTVMFTYVVGIQTANSTQMMNAYLAQGNLTDEAGNPVVCKPVLTSKRNVDWNCTIQNLTEVKA